jgi:hypothetical protein
MSANKFDDFLNQSFSGYSPEVPPHIWENITAERKKKRPGIFWLTEKKALLILAALLLAGAGIYMMANKKNNSQNIAHENTGSGQGTGKTVPAAVLQDKNANGIATNSGSTNEQSKENKKTTAAENDKAPAQVTKSPHTNLSKNAGIDKSVLASTDNKNDNASILSTNRKDNRQRVTGKRGRQKITSANPFAAEINDDNGNDNAAIDELIIPFLEGSRDKITVNKENILGKQTIQINPTNIKLREDCPGAAGNKYYFEAYISPDYAIKKYNDTGNSVLVEKRKESLHVQSAFSAGLRYTRVFANGMSVRTGINYSQVNEKFSYAQDNVVQIVYVINNAGDTTDRYYVRGTRYRNSYNHYRTIDVPLVVGYEMGNGNFHANINAGAVINLYSWQKGETLDNSGSPVSITTGKDDNPYQYKTNVGVGFTAAASFYYKFSDRFHVMAEPYFRYNFSPMNREALSIQEKFTTIGLKLGIRMDLK